MVIYSIAGGIQMKKKVYIFLILISIVFVLVACNTNQEEQQAEDQTPQPSDDQPSEEKTDESSEEELNESEEQAEESEETEKPEIAYQINENSSVVPLDDANEKVVLLTIDDAPDNYALEMANTLKELEANAIFFVNGHFLNTDEEKDTLKKIYDMGFLIGNHTMTHQNLTEVNEEIQYEEIVGLNDLIEDIIGERPKFFRAPHGANTDYSEQLAEKQGMVQMNWTYGYDYFSPYQDAEKLTEAMVSGEGPEVDVDYSLLKSGANLLMHDREWTNNALEDIVSGLREKGYEIVDPHTIKTVN